MTDTRRVTLRAADTGPIVLGGLRTAWEPLAKQAVVTVLLVGAAVASSVLPWLPVSDGERMWQGVVLAVLLLLGTAAMARWRALQRFEIVVPMLDFLAIGLLRYGTGDTRSVFLAIIILPVIWIAAGPGRWRILAPLLGTCVTLLLPYVLSTASQPEASELVRLVVAVLVYAAAGAVTNELSRQAQQQLTVAQRHRRVAESEVTQAAIVQRSLQPRATDAMPTGFHAVGVCVPARTVGGDFYDWYPTADGAALVLGDVMGKGVGAGMIAAAVRAVIRSSIDHDDPAVAFERAAAGLTTGSVDGGSAQFTTCFHARLGSDGTVRWVDAGHGLTVLRRSDGTTHFLRSAHLPIGIGTSWESEETVLDVGDSLISISDGVLDLFADDSTSLDRWEEFVAARHDVSAIVADVTELAANADHPDDVTVVGVTRVGDDPAAASASVPVPGIVRSAGPR